jgi:hypothetical protein
MVIADVTHVNMWAKLSPSATRPQIEVYKLKWVFPSSNGEVPPVHSPLWKNICDDAMLRADSIELDLPAAPGSTLTSARAAPIPAPPPSETYIPNDVTFVFEGERINAETKLIYDFDLAWFNLGCAGHLLSKMHLMGHVAATAEMGYVTTLAERQTIMRMFAADYCGTGKAFTVPGIRLQWHDHRNWLPYSPETPPLEYDVEARWTPYGAACLAIPRVEAYPTDDSDAEFPDGVRLAIDEECQRPPACWNQNARDLAGTHMITVNP